MKTLVDTSASFTYAAVAAKTSILLALVIIERAKEKHAEKIAIIPSRTPLDCMIYNATTEHIGRSEATTVARMLSTDSRVDSL